MIDYQQAIRTLNGNDPAGQSVASNITTQARSAIWLLEMLRTEFQRFKLQRVF